MNETIELLLTMLAFHMYHVLSLAFLKKDLVIGSADSGVAASVPDTPPWMIGCIAANFVWFVLANTLGVSLFAKIKQRNRNSKKGSSGTTSSQPRSEVAMKLALSATIPVAVLVVPIAITYRADRINGIEFDNFVRMNDNVRIGISSIFVLIGMALMSSTNRIFVREGKGTLSPVEELQTQHLVVSGPFAYVRNPMIIGVLSIVLGLALLIKSIRFLGFVPYAFVVKTLWFVYSEEPSMRRRFGSAYEDYAANVGRWVPRFDGPYKPKSTS